MFASIRRHQKWLFFVIVVLVIVAFVFFFTPQQGRGVSGGASGRMEVARLNGEPISRQEYFNARKDAELRYRLFARQWPDASDAGRQMFNEREEVETRLLVKQKVRELGIEVGDGAVADWIRSVFQGPERTGFDKETYERFKTEIRTRGYTDRDLYRFVAGQVGLQHLMELYGAPGSMVTPQEARKLYLEENERYDAEVVLFPLTNYLAEVTLDPAGIAQFYTNRSSMYREPEQIAVSYVEFSITNYYEQAQQELNQQTNLEQVLEMVYQQRGTNFYRDISKEEAKERILEETRDELARREAHRKANDFIEELMEMAAREGAANLAQVAEEKDKEVKETEPFSRFRGPQEVDVPGAFATAAFEVSEAKPFSTRAIVGNDAVYVLALKERVPSRVPPLDEVRERVVEDYRRNQAQDLAREAGVEFYQTATNALAEGKSLQALAEEQNVDYIDLKPFSQNTPSLPEIRGSADFSAMKNAALALTPGELSRFTPTRDGGFVLYVEEKLPVEETKLEEELPSFEESLRRRRRFQAFEEWLQHASQEGRFTILGEEQGSS